MKYRVEASDVHEMYKRDNDNLSVSSANSVKTDAESILKAH
jgi:hypothetical protein